MGGVGGAGGRGRHAERAGRAEERGSPLKSAERARPTRPGAGVREAMGARARELVRFPRAHARARGRACAGMSSAMLWSYASILRARNPFRSH